MKKYFVSLAILTASVSSTASVSECTSEKMQFALKKALQRPLYERFHKIQNAKAAAGYWQGPGYIGYDTFKILKVKDNSTTMLSDGLTATPLFGQYFLANYDAYEVSFKICYDCKNEDRGRVYLYDRSQNLNEKFVEFTQPQVLIPNGNFPNLPNQPLCVMKARARDNRSYEMSPVPSFRGYDDILDHEIFETIVKVENETPPGCFEFSSGNITRYKCDNVSDVIIPKTINNQPVTKIAVGFYGQGAFSNKGIGSIVIPDTVTEIGNYAFENNNLTKIEIPSSVVKIGAFAFNRNQLSKLQISKSIIAIGSSAFANNQLNYIDIPDTIQIIEDGTFEGNHLTRVILPNSVKSIGERAFFENQIVEAIFPKTLNVIGNIAFSHNKLKKVVLSTTTKLSPSWGGGQTSFDSGVMIERK